MRCRDLLDAIPAAGFVRDGYRVEQITAAHH